MKAIILGALVAALVGCSPERITSPVHRHGVPLAPGDSSGFGHPAAGTWVCPQATAWITPAGDCSLVVDNMRLYAQVAGPVTDHRFFRGQGRYVLKLRGSGGEVDWGWNNVPDSVATITGGSAWVAYNDPTYQTIQVKALLRILGGPWPDQTAEAYLVLKRG